jgi:hypothetical protein
MARNGRTALVAVVALGLSVAGCEDDGSGSCTLVDPTLSLSTLTVAATGGFDDFGSAGAAMGYAVDSTNDLTVVAALKFPLPGGQYGFTLGCSAADAAASWSVVPTGWPTPSGVDATTWPILESVLTNSTGIRALTSTSSGAVFILLEGDPTLAAPTRILVADSGDVTLFREDGPYDRIEASGLQFREVDGLGAGAQLTGSEVVRIDWLAFDWPTPGMEL